MTNVSVAALLLRLVVSLGIVVVLMAAVARVARGRLGRVAGRASAPSLQLQVLARQPIGKNASVVHVRAGDKALLLGVTEHSVSLIQETELPASAPEPEAAPSIPLPLGAVLQRARDLTVRRA